MSDDRVPAPVSTELRLCSLGRLASTNRDAASAAGLAPTRSATTDARRTAAGKEVLYDGQTPMGPIHPGQSVNLACAYLGKSFCSWSMPTRLPYSHN